MEGRTSPALLECAATPCATTEPSTVDVIIDRYDRDPGMLIPMMQDLQAACGYLPRPELMELSAKVGAPLARIYSVATFSTLPSGWCPKGSTRSSSAWERCAFSKGPD